MRTDFKNNQNCLEIWYLAIRPKTLPAAAAPVIVGISLALGSGVFRPGPALAALLAALLLQIGSNLANDVFDFKRGTDTEERTGPLRVTQAGLLSPGQVMAGMWVVFVLAALAGVYLIYQGGWPILLIGILAILSAVAYTAGPFPLGYHGLGDIFVFIFFGPVAVMGTYYVQAGTFSTLSLWASLPMGFLITAILVVNNLRDIETDRKAGKRTAAVRLGSRFTQLEYFFLLILSYLVPLIIQLTEAVSPWVLLSWVSLPLAFSLVHDVSVRKGKSLNITLAGTARLALVYAVLFSLGLVI